MNYNDSETGRHYPNNPIPILLVVRQLGFGGIERDVVKLALGLDRRRFTPFVATYKPYGPRYDELRAAGVPVLSLELDSFASSQALSAARRFRSFIRENRIRVVHAFDPSSVFAVPLARLFGVPVVVSSQLGSRALHDPKTRKQLKIADWLSDSIVVNCEALRTHLADEHNVPRERIELCYNGVDTREFYPDREARIREVADASLLIGTACVLRPEKAIHLLLSAFARVKHNKVGAKLLIIGDGPELQRLKQLSAELALGGDCVFVPAAAKVAPLLRSMDIFVSSSRSEAFSNSILEAMACGCAVIGSRVGGTPELIGDDERGLLFTSDRVDELAAKLSRMMACDVLRQTLAAKAADHARTVLSLQNNVDRATQIYERVLRRKQILNSSDLM
jgi:L-malate glycosyltransferase